MRLLTDEYIKFMDAVPHPDRYTTADQKQALIDHYGMDEHLAKQLYDEWIALVFNRMPWSPADD